MYSILIWITGEYVTFAQNETGCVKFYTSLEEARTAELEYQEMDVEQTKIINLEEVVE
jgi:hypothetical protein